MNIYLNFWQAIPSFIDPVAFSFFGFEIRYYSLMYLVAFVVVYALVSYRIKSEKQFKGISIETVQDIFLVAIIGVILGGRIGYALFYNFDYYLVNPLELMIPIDLSTGKFTGITGMSFHGGLIGAILASFGYIKYKGIDFKKFENLIMPAVPLGYMFGRIGNFLNNELWGRETASWLGMKVGGAMRHPSQLYEAFFEGLVLFVLFWIFRNHKWFQNKFLALFLIGYGLFRFLIEFLREPDEHIGFLALNLSLGQYLCLVMILIGFVIGFRSKKFDT